MDAATGALWAPDRLGTPRWSVPAVGYLQRIAMSKDGAMVSVVTNRPGVFNPEVVVRMPDDDDVAWSVKAHFGVLAAWPGVAWGDDGVIYAAAIDELYVIDAE